MDYEKIVLVTRKTRLEGLVERFNTKSQAKFYIAQNEMQVKARKAMKQGITTLPKMDANAGSFPMYEREHENYYEALRLLRQQLQRLTKVQEIERGFLPNFLFAETDLVVTIGIDGLVVNTAKYLSGQPVVAVNPDPAHIDGILLPFTVADAPAVVSRLLQGQAQITPITMAKAELNDGQQLLAFNDFFIGTRTHVSARYHINIGGREESHSSSGVIVSTGAGATGWMSSLFNMANGIISNFGTGQDAVDKPIVPWDTEHLIFIVREPFVSKTSAATVVCGQISAANPLVLESNMAEGGVIFSDGVEADYLAFNAGTIATIGLAERKTRLVVG